ncbi:hypothetical protein HGRIS_002757 [Hohenbuehelia grisea]|uniref:gluconokinase n=1 Tax=Hohenbuehelia grisea TaxID=104357 RepID=A0ABR3JLL4_9AGAR
MSVNNSDLPKASDDQGTDQCLIIVMGVSGTGKSTLGRALATALGMPFVEGDDLHPRANVEKMSAGQPLTDADRAPWLELVRTTGERIARGQLETPHEAPPTHNQAPLAGARGAVVTCSSLKRTYREILRGRSKPATEANAIPSHLEPPHPHVLPGYFVFIKGDRETLMERMEARKGHFMKAGMLDSQLDTLENPEGEEGVVVVDLKDTTDRQVEVALEGLKRLVINI